MSLGMIVSHSYRPSHRSSEIKFHTDIKVICKVPKSEFRVSKFITPTLKTVINTFPKYHRRLIRILADLEGNVTVLIFSTSTEFSKNLEHFIADS